MNDKNAMRLISQGHDVHRDRGTYTHAAFDNHLPPETIITKDGEPLWVEQWNRAMTVGDALPERVAIAVGPDGELYDGNDFAERYKRYLDGYNTGRDATYEPCPNPVTYIRTVLDPMYKDTEKLRYLEVGFDPRVDNKPKMTGLYGPDGSKYEEWIRNNPQNAPAQVDERSTKAEQIIDLHTAGDITDEVRDRKILELFGGEPVEATPDEPVEEEIVEEEPEQAAAEPAVTFDAQPPPSTEPGMWTAPCGKELEIVHKNRHAARCGHLKCAEERLERV